MALFPAASRLYNATKLPVGPDRAATVTPLQWAPLPKQSPFTLFAVHQHSVLSAWLAGPQSLVEEVRRACAKCSSSLGVFIHAHTHSFSL